MQLNTGVAHPLQVESSAFLYSSLLVNECYILTVKSVRVLAVLTVLPIFRKLFITYKDWNYQGISLQATVSNILSQLTHFEQNALPDT